MSPTKINNIEAIFFIMTIMINHIIMNMPKSLLNTTGSATILNIIFIFIIILFIVYFISKVMNKFPNQDILDISSFLGGKFLKNTIAVLFVLYFLFSASVFLRSFCGAIKILYFPRTPIFFLLIFFIIGIILCNRVGFSAIIKANLIFMPFVLFSIIFIFLANIDNLIPEKVFPLLGNGISTTFLSGLSNLYAFGGLAFLYLVPPYLKESKAVKKVAFISMILSCIWLIFSVITLLFIFPALTTTDEILPLYFASRFIEFGRFFQRLDSIFLFIWIISILSYLCILVNIIVQLFRRITHFKYQYATIYLFAFLIFSLALIPQNLAQINFLETTVYQYVVIIINFIICIPVLFFAYLKNKRQTKLQEKGEKVP